MLANDPLPTLPPKAVAFTTTTPSNLSPSIRASLDRAITELKDGNGVLLGVVQKDANGNQVSGNLVIVQRINNHWSVQGWVGKENGWKTWDGITWGVQTEARW